MSDEDEVDELLNEIRSDDDESADAERADSDMGDTDMEDSNNVSDVEENMMSGDDDDSMGEDGGITQAEVYDNLKR
ncbi:MAG TPA: hypothetical protein VJ828_20260, partial [Lacipirellulaceae bacterium]|nr:hypothetical protein [Lacipirellulaceae bacterium]